MSWNGTRDLKKNAHPFNGDRNCLLPPCLSTYRTLNMDDGYKTKTALLIEELATGTAFALILALFILLAKAGVERL